MTINAGDILEIDARMEFDGSEDVINNYQILMGSISSPDEQDVIDDILAWLETLYVIFQGVQTIKLFFRDVRIFNKTLDELVGLFAWPTLVTGQSNEPPLPPGVAGLVQFNTVVPRVLLRKYIGGWVEETLSASGQWTLAETAKLATFGTLCASPQATPNASWVYGYDSPKTASFVTPTSSVATSIPAYQRRRRQGRGS